MGLISTGNPDGAGDGFGNLKGGYDRGRVFARFGRRTRQILRA